MIKIILTNWAEAKYYEMKYDYVFIDPKIKNLHGEELLEHYHHYIQYVEIDRNEKNISLDIPVSIGKLDIDKYDNTKNTIRLDLFFIYSKSLVSLINILNKTLNPAPAAESHLLTKNTGVDRRLLLCFENYMMGEVDIV